MILERLWPLCKAKYKCIKRSIYQLVFCLRNNVFYAVYKTDSKKYNAVQIVRACALVACILLFRC